jgi:hypothetical protein
LDFEEESNLELALHPAEIHGPIDDIKVRVNALRDGIHCLAKVELEEKRVSQHMQLTARALSPDRGTRQ